MPTAKTTKTADQKRRQAFEQLRDLLKDPSPSLDWHHKAGKLMLQLLPESPRSEQYAKAKILKLRDRLGLPEHRQNFLYAVREFAHQYKRIVELKDLEGLSWSHVHFLLGVSPKQRGRLVKKCLQQKLSCQALLQLIYELRPNRPSGGRRPADPKPLGPKAALKETLRLSDQWVDRCSFWLKKATPELRKRKHDPDLAKLISKAESALAQLHKVVGDRRKDLRSLLRKDR